MREFFKLKIWKASLVAIAAIILIGSAVVFYELKKETKISQAGAGHNVLGFAWSENIGWISFNSSNCDTDSNSFIDTDAMVQGCGGDNSTDAVFDYGVNVDLAGNGSFSGYAWSSNIGWISFDKTIAGNPPGAPYNAGETFMAKLNTGTGELSGWARALSACQDDLWDGTKCTGVGAGDKSGGWDGWIKLRRDPADALPDYGTSLNVSDFEGWAWGDSVVGWVSFNSKNCDVDVNTFTDVVCGGDNATTTIINYKVYLFDSFPTATTVAVQPIDYCSTNLLSGVELMWNFIDTEDNLAIIPQTGYKINLERSDLNSCSIVKNPDASASITGTEINAVCGGFIAYGGYTYTWKVEVYDSAGNSSPLAAGDPFPDDANVGGAPNPTPDHQYPIAKFEFTPAQPPATILQFQSIDFDPLLSQVFGGFSIANWTWNFGDGSPLVSIDNDNPPITDGKATYSYPETGLYVVDLKITDSSPQAYHCWASQNMPVNTKNITINENKPKWNEVNP